LLEVPSKASTNTRTGPSGERVDVRATADSHFGWLRTRLSLERTMMSWLRTAVSLIGFGFAAELSKPLGYATGQFGKNHSRTGLHWMDKQTDECARTWRRVAIGRSWYLDDGRP
jgi:Domain of unknown function (DUF202)